ncbi:class I SAM-dependent methyltransferase [Kribbella deserti]|uniref:Class I SAM-dependent methyltransferase n=1 Tax=Kribbella deserti TaxID=1926257 RepID=A0ABV6QIW8_9ACTN
MGLDWGAGEYELTAAKLAPAATAVVEAAELEVGEVVVDVGCGTGNASLAAAERGAQVLGVDPSERLLAVATERVASRFPGQARFARGEAAELPVPDGSADAIVSAFGLIFAPDPAAAVRECARATAPRGRVVFSAWTPTGPLSRFTDTIGQYVREALGAPESEPGFGWHDPADLRPLFAEHGFKVAVEPAKLIFTSTSIDEFVDEQNRHPMALSANAALSSVPDAQAKLDGLNALIQTTLMEINEDPEAFQMTADYVIITATR